MTILARASTLLLLLISSASSAMAPWVVFFDHATARPLDEYNKTLDEVVAWHRKFDIRRFRVRGHADTSGSLEANQKLSTRRAEAVKAALVRRGVSPQIIFVEAHGETVPLGARVDGIPHPEDRRVEILAEMMCRPPSGAPQC